MDVGILKLLPALLLSLSLQDLPTIVKILLPNIQPLDGIKSVVSILHSAEPVESTVSVLDFVGLVERHGYTAEEYNVITADGYILQLHRISGSPKSPKAPNKPVVYIQHGILLSSDSWVLIGPGKDLAFLLADAGKDVWIGNTRGNAYCRSHVWLDPDSFEFWNFSYHEMAVYDVKQMIDFILEKTGAEKLRYYGYSMGTTISYVLLSMLPEYNDKIEMLYSLMPVVFWKHELRPVMAALNSIFEPLEEFLTIMRIKSVYPKTATAAYIGKNYCGDDSFLTQIACVRLFSKIGLDRERFNKTALPEILAHFPAGTSTINVFHYNENYKRDKFEAFDYGVEENMKRYNQSTPVEYNLTRVTAPVSLWYAKDDGIVNPQDVFELAKRLPNVKSVNAVSHPKFNHFDLLWAIDAREQIYDKLL